MMNVGPAPEILQARLREASAKAEAENPTPPVVEEDRFYAYIDGAPKELKRSEVQAYIDLHKLRELNACRLGETAWVNAATLGFVYPLVEDGENTEAVPLGTPKTPQEEELETYPDDQLVQMAKLNNVEVQYDENNQVMRPELVKALTPFVK